MQRQTQHVSLAAEVNLSLLASITSGFREEDLVNLVNEAVATARRQQRNEVTEADFEAALTKLVLGGAHLLLPDAEERRQAGYHLAGHLLVAWYTPAAELPKQVYLLDYTREFPAPEEKNIEEWQAEHATWLARLDVLLGGPAAVNLRGDKVTAHGETDMAAALQLARHIVSRWRNHGNASSAPERKKSSLLQTLLDKSGIKTPRVVNQEAQLLLAERQQAVERLLATQHESLADLVALLVHEEVVDRAALENILGERP